MKDQHIFKKPWCLILSLWWLWSLTSNWNLSIKAFFFFSPFRNSSNYDRFMTISMGFCIFPFRETETNRYLDLQCTLMKSGNPGLQTQLWLVDNGTILFPVHSLSVYFLTLTAWKLRFFNSRKEISLFWHKWISISTTGPIKPRKFALSPA